MANLEYYLDLMIFMDILKISISIAVIGIVALFFLVQFNNESTTKIEDLKTGQTTKITGMVTSAYVSKNNNVFLKVSDDTGEISVVVFKSSNIDMAYDLENGEQISVSGRVDEYEGSLEIIAKEISKV